MSNTSANGAETDATLVSLLKHMPDGAFDAWLAGEGAGLAGYIAETTHQEAADVGRRLAVVRANRAALKRCLALPKIEQRTPAWYAAREHILTASDLGQALGKSKYGTRKTLLLQKTKFEERTFDRFARRAMDNGVMFEPMALRAYQMARGGLPVYDFGLLCHPTLTCFGASPDGITALGTCVEIKCPLTRKLTGTVPPHYYYQMQGQMAVCGVTETDYIEAKFERMPASEYLAAPPPACHGVTVRLVDRGTGENRYMHSPPDMAPSEAVAWANSAAGAVLEAEPHTDVGEMVHWHNVRLDIIRVEFDAVAWDTMMAPGILAFHEDRQQMAARLTQGMSPYEGYAEKTKRTVVPRADPDIEPGVNQEFVDSDGE